ncbi:MAG: S41 family peptidase [Bacteroidaceae bacterium]|nr:S41 family peptidase [Bacteroidaceae bacterium]
MNSNLKNRIWVLAALVMMLLPAGCSWNEESHDREFADTPQGNFMALWTIMDERYCFFDLKKEQFGVDWDEVKTRYAASISDDMTDRSLFEVLCNMIGELRDGHVNLTSVYDLGRNWCWKTDYPANYSKDLQTKYLGNDYVIGGNGYYYCILDDNIGYLVVESFESAMSDSRLNVMFNNMALCNGLIIDIRDNGGGLLTASESLASRFTEKKVTVSYCCYKTGPGHNDFSRRYSNELSPNEYNLRWIKPVVLLTNRGCYSSANDFSLIMKALDNVTLMGDTTGGGGGLPLSSELPNGWVVRFSSSPTFDVEMNHVESGVAPDIRLDMKDEDILSGKDTYIEAARKYINDKLVNP